jgi:DnaJ like chaperone protein
MKATHLGPHVDDPYAVIGAEPGASDEEVRKAWRRALSEAHPDRVMARGLPAEFIEVAHAKSSAINAAYDAIVSSRKAWAPVGA